MNNNTALPTSACSAAGRARLLIVMAGIALLAAACSSATNSNSAAPSSTNTTSTTVNTSSTSATSSTGVASSPIAAYKAFQEANRKKDYEAVKRRFSKASLEMLTEEAKKDNKTLDEFVRQQVDKGKNDEEVVNEKITGDTATVDLKDGSSSLTLPMVKEDGEWKIDYVTLMKQLQDAFSDMTKEGSKPADNQKKSNGNVNQK